MTPPRVLIVEDEGIIAEYIRNALSERGFNVIGVTGDGEEAIKLSKSQTPDIILMDIHLNGNQNGVETMRKIQNHHHVPVLYLTAHQNETLIEKAQKTQHHGFLTKPIVEERMISRVRTVLETEASEAEPDLSSGTGSNKTS